MGFCEILTLVFVVLKVIGKIDWSWWLVLLPEILAACFYVAIVIVELRSRAKIMKEFKEFSPRRW